MASELWDEKEVFKEIMWGWYVSKIKGLDDAEESDSDKDSAMRAISDH